MAKHYNVVVKYDDPYPKTHEQIAVEASSAGRAAYLVEKQWRKTRPRKREPQNIQFVVIRL
jgi:hypothetical protein